MFGLGFGELLLIFLIALIFIGPKKLPELAKGLGQGIKEFQKAAKGLTDQLQDSGEEADKQKPQETQKIADTSRQEEKKIIETEATPKKEEHHS